MRAGRSRGVQAAGRQRLVRVALAALAVAIAWAFAATVLRHTRPMALPLDDSYGALRCARALARGHACAGEGATLWSLVLAPLWAIGARGPALVWAAFVASIALYVATALGVHRVVRAIAGDAAAVIAALALLGLAAFAGSALAGSEAALAGALLVMLIGALLVAPRGPPGVALAVAIAGALLAGRELAVIAIAVGAARAVQARRARPVAAAWLVLVLVPLLWRRALTGQWIGALDGERGTWTQAGRMLRAVFWDATSPLVCPRAIAALWLAGAVRVIAWARRARHGLAGATILAAPMVVMLGAAASGRWSADHGRFLAPALPVLILVAGCALASLRTGAVRWLARAASLVALAGFAALAIPGVVAEARRFAQAASDVDVAVAAGRYLARTRPGAPAMAEQPGAVGYAADAAVAALPTRDGAGALFELLERLPPDEHPASFVLDPTGPAAAAIAELSGDLGFRGVLRAAFGPRERAHAADVVAARWDHTASGERPLDDHAGWAIVDRVDVADRDAEAAHGWAGAPGLDDAAPARRSVLGREVGAHGLILDGGRSLRAERFEVAIDPRKLARLVLRTGGARSYPGHGADGALVRAVPLRLLDDAGRELARATLPAPDGRFVEISFALPAGAPRVVRTEAASPYRAFHWFVLQPE